MFSSFSQTKGLLWSAWNSRTKHARKRHWPWRKQTKDAVDKAKDAVDEATRKSASIWSPFAKAFIVIAAAAAVASVIVSYLVARP